MKPSDSPEFFQLPSPAGRSRESTLVLDATGRFWHDGRPVEHAAMAQAFARWVSRHPENGRYILSNGYDWTYLKVEGAPLFVSGLRVAPETVWLVLRGGAEEPLEPATLRVGEDGVVSAEVRGATMTARFTPTAQAELAPFLVEGPQGTPEFEFAGVRTRIAGSSLGAPQVVA